MDHDIAPLNNDLLNYQSSFFNEERTADDVTFFKELLQNLNQPTTLKEPLIHKKYDLIKNKRSITTEIKQYKDAMKDLKEILIWNEL